MERYQQSVFFHKLKPINSSISVLQCIFASISSYSCGAAISIPSMVSNDLEVSESIFDSCKVQQISEPYLKAGGAIYAFLQNNMKIEKSCFSECHAQDCDVIYYMAKSSKFSNIYFDIGNTNNAFIFTISDNPLLKYCNNSNIVTQFEQVAIFLCNFSFNYFYNSVLGPGFVILSITDSYFLNCTITQSAVVILINCYFKNTTIFNLNITYASENNLAENETSCPGTFAIC